MWCSLSLPLSSRDPSTGSAPDFTTSTATRAETTTPLPQAPSTASTPSAFPEETSIDIEAIQRELKGGWFQKGISDEKLQELSIAGADKLQIKVNTGVWAGIWEETELAGHMYDIMYPIHRVVGKFPRLKEIAVEVVAPAVQSHDEYGNPLPESEAMIAFLRIDCDDLRRFKDENVNLFTAVYIANRYVKDISEINWHLRKTWQAELREQSNNLNVE